MIVSPSSEEISIHAPRAGGDVRYPNGYTYNAGFQSTPPVRGATLYQVVGGHGGGISIHAPRAGGDSRRRLNMAYIHEFQSTPPVRGATYNAGVDVLSAQFQSTPPVRGATKN